MLSSGPTIQQAEVIATVLLITAPVVTSFRLFLRMRQRRLWLDDAWAVLAMVFNTSFLVAIWLYLHDYAQFPQDTKVVLYYMCILLMS
ncbi:hypothetical protein BKA82DRAFT_4049863 [Pisolithus tinctorius]|nr:hypothetical protein BKA82DRAFT_4049863 [Pisolithus tinctorius]